MLDMRTIRDLESLLHLQIKGQDEVVSSVAEILRRGELNITNPERPKGCFLFLGPTGTGKTELTKTFTKIIFGEDKLYQFDMSEYQTRESVESLIGDKTGWNGRLGEALLKSNGTGTLLFDEIEKADRNVLDIFLQMMNDARITTGTGVTHDLSQYYIAMTSNLGADKLMSSRKLNFATIRKSIISTLSQHGLRDEFLGRFNLKVIFSPLNHETFLEIAELILQQEILRMSQILSKKYRYHINLEKDDEVVMHTVMESANFRLGARPIRNFVETSLQNAVAEKILNDEVPEGIIKVDGCKYIIVK